MGIPQTTTEPAIQPGDAPGLRILFTAAEADPLAKVGGLGDVAGSLPLALRALPPEKTGGRPLEIRLVIPFHGAAARAKDIRPVASFSIPGLQGSTPATVFETSLGGLPVYMVAGGPIAADSPVYYCDSQKDGEKYTFFSLAILELAHRLGFQPDILHAHDWHTGLAVYSLAACREDDPFFASTRSVFTVHNLPFMGAGADASLEAFGIPPGQDERLPGWGRYQPLPLGLSAADRITTVSPSYAREIMTGEFGCGLQDFLRARSADITGILNGIDESAWDPTTDPAISAPFGKTSLDQRSANKQALLRECSLNPDLDLPLLVFIGRLDRQKGVDVAVEALRQVAGLPWQAVLLGTGDPALEDRVRRLEAEFPYRMRGIIRFDAAFSRRMYAGGDMLLMPSRYEPCGLAQMIAMRYGCVPVARATGGLKDTIKETPSPETSTGFLFDDPSPEALAAALRRALAAYQDRPGWRARQVSGMQQDFSWSRSAAAYAQIYLELHESSPGR